MVAVTQDIVGTAADDHAGLIVCQFPDQFRLEAEQVVRRDNVLSQGRLLDDLVQKMVAGPFIVDMEEFFQDTAPVRDHAEDILVIVGDIQVSGKCLCDQRSARPALTS